MSAHNSLTRSPVPSRVSTTAAFRTACRSSNPRARQRSISARSSVTSAGARNLSGVTNQVEDDGIARGFTVTVRRRDGCDPFLDGGPSYVTLNAEGASPDGWRRLRGPRVTTTRMRSIVRVACGGRAGTSTALAARAGESPRDSREGASYRSIARTLTAEGYRPRGASAWSDVVVRTILTGISSCSVPRI